MAGDRTRGEFDQAKGMVKEKVGKVTGDRSTEVSGKLDQVKGKIEKTIGKAKGSIRDKVDRNR
ncbi:MAG: CsbD family protein [Chloroflexota bacterium]